MQPASLSATRRSTGRRHPGCNAPPRRAGRASGRPASRRPARRPRPRSAPPRRRRNDLHVRPLAEHIPEVTHQRRPPSRPITSPPGAMLASMSGAVVIEFPCSAPVLLGGWCNASRAGSNSITTTRPSTSRQRDAFTHGTAAIGERLARRAAPCVEKRRHPRRPTRKSTLGPGGRRRDILHLVGRGERHLDDRREQQENVAPPAELPCCHQPGDGRGDDRSAPNCSRNRPRTR